MFQTYVEPAGWGIVYLNSTGITLHISICVITGTLVFGRYVNSIFIIFKSRGGCIRLNIHTKQHCVCTSYIHTIINISSANRHTETIICVYSK